MRRIAELDLRCIKADDMRIAEAQRCFAFGENRGQNSAQYGPIWDCPALAGMLLDMMARLNGWEAGYNNASKRAGSDVFVGEMRKNAQKAHECLCAVLVELDKSIGDERGRAATASPV